MQNGFIFQNDSKQWWYMRIHQRVVFRLYLLFPTCDSYTVISFSVHKWFFWVVEYEIRMNNQKNSCLLWSLLHHFALGWSLYLVRRSSAMWYLTSSFRVSKTNRRYLRVSLEKQSNQAPEYSTEVQWGLEQLFIIEGTTWFHWCVVTESNRHPGKRDLCSLS